MAIPPKGRADHLVLGDWNAICSVCGQKFKASEMVQLPAGIGGPWGGKTYVCKRDWRPRQTQDFVRGIPDKMSPPWTQPPVDISGLNVIEDDTGDGDIEIDVCSYPEAPVVINVREFTEILTIALGTGPAVEITVNGFSPVGLIETTVEADPCLPSAITVVVNNIAQGLNLNFVTEPTDNEGEVFSVQVELRIGGSRITSFTGNITLALGDAPVGATLSGTLTQAAVAGLATFNDLEVDLAGNYTLIASYSNSYQSVSVESVIFTRELPDLTFTTEPQDTPFNIVMAAVEVSAMANGSVDTSYEEDVTIALGENPGGATLSGTLTVTAVNGVATFDDLEIDVQDEGYTLVATGTSADAGESAEFDIVEGVISQETLYNLPASTFSSLGVFGITFYDSLLWINTQVGGDRRQLLVFDFDQSNNPMTTIDSAGERNVIGTIYEETQPPGYVILSSGTVNLYRAAFDAVGLESVNLGIDSNLINTNGGVTSDANGLVWASLVGGGIMQFNPIDWVSGTCTIINIPTPVGFSNVRLAERGAAIENRAYVWNIANPGKLGYMEEDGDYVNCADWDFVTGTPLLGGQYADQSSTFIYVTSGNTGDRNVIEKRDVDGVLVDSVRLDDISPTSLTTGLMVFDYVNELLWVPGGTNQVFCIDVNTMTLVYSDTVAAGTLLVGPVGLGRAGSGVGGVLAVTKPDGSNATRLVRLFIGA